MFGDLSEDDLRVILDKIDKQFGDGLNGLFSGEGCGIFRFGDMLASSEYPDEMLLTAAAEGFRLLSVVLTLSLVNDGTTTLVDPFTEGVITGMTVDEDSVGVFDEDVTIEALSEYIQTGISLFPNVPAIMDHIVEHDGGMAFEFIHAVIHGCAGLLAIIPNIEPGPVADHLKGFGYEPAISTAKWN